MSEQPDRAFFGDNEMKLGTFCLNISGGMMMSTAAKNTLDWAENVAVAQAADSRARSSCCLWAGGVDKAGGTTRTPSNTRRSRGRRRLLR